jgi:FlaG/FlaF family flagellin (archaellin)
MRSIELKNDRLFVRVDNQVVIVKAETFRKAKTHAHVNEVRCDYHWVEITYYQDGNHLTVEINALTPTYAQEIVDTIANLMAEYK